MATEFSTARGEKAATFQLSCPSQLMFEEKKGVTVEHFLQQK